MRKILFFLLPLTLSAFENKPWLGTLAEFEFNTAFAYSYYPDVDNGFNPRSYSSHNRLLTLGLGIAFQPTWDFQVETEFTNTRKLSPTTRSAGLQLRYLWLNDIEGDPITLTTGVLFRYVPSHTLHDVSTPYHSRLNYEFNLAIGKEFDKTYNWTHRIYALIPLGIANRGDPYIRPLISYQINHQNKHNLGIFSEAYLGFGTKEGVNVNKFNSYASIYHQSIDVGLSYTYHFDIWGSLSLSYAFRPHAHNYPEHNSTFLIAYRLPFSVF